MGNLQRFLGILALGLLVLGMVSGCRRTSSARTVQMHPRVQVQIKGSDTMVNLNQALAERYMAQQRGGAQIMVTGGGSGTGFTALLQGTTDIAAASRAIKAEERAKATARGVALQEITVGWDGIAVIVHPANPLKSLTVHQLAMLFTGH